MRQPIFIGDVQGCADELEELIQRARTAFGEDGYELWLVGDLVNRGPASLRVLREIRGQVEAGRARVVLGNHELGLLQMALGLREPSRLDTSAGILGLPEAAGWIDWIRRLPLAATGTLGRRRFAMVHAAVHPDWDLDELVARARACERRLGGSDLAETRRLLAVRREADPDRDALGLLTQCRGIDARGRWNDDPTRTKDVWHRRWAARGHDYAVVYGHWAMQGLQCADALRGLDTGCVHHGRSGDGFLTAWLPDLHARDPFALPESGKLWQVRARRAYYLELEESTGGVDSA
jgi:bis(5'-nucleosyl)-tetraphosphatase (symmetrical)